MPSAGGWWRILCVAFVFGGRRLAQEPGDRANGQLKNVLTQFLACQRRVAEHTGLAHGYRDWVNTRKSWGQPLIISISDGGGLVSGGDGAGGALDSLGQRGVVNLTLAQALKLTANRRSGAHAE